MGHSSSHLRLYNTFFSFRKHNGTHHQVRAKNKNGKLAISVISCSNLPDCDLAGIGFGNKSDPYVIVKVGKDGEPQKTKAVAGKLNPVFPKGTSTFTFDVEDP